MSVRLAIVGNIIDLGPRDHFSPGDLDAALKQAVETPLPAKAISELREAVAQAGSILYLADNAGEIVFDRLLLRQLPMEQVTLAVRGGATINDATRKDAREAGVDKLVTVIDNGTRIPGTYLPLCSEPFRQQFEKADLIISKGQGNYETLMSCKKPSLFFLFKVKCVGVSRYTGLPVGSMVCSKA